MLPVSPSAICLEYPPTHTHTLQNLAEILNHDGVDDGFDLVM